MDLEDTVAFLYDIRVLFWKMEFLVLWSNRGGHPEIWKKGEGKNTQVKNSMCSQWGLNPQPFTQQSCMLPWLYQEHIIMNWKTKLLFIANNEDSIIHVTQWSKPPTYFWLSKGILCKKKSSFFITGSFNRILCIRKCHSNVDYVEKEFKMPT